MRPTSRLFTAAALVLVSGSAFAQTPAASAVPNFAGKWVILPDSGAAVQQQGMRGGAQMGGLGEEATIVQDEKSISITRASQMGTLTSVFKTDSTQTHQQLNIGNGTMLDLTLQARWDDKKFITSTWVNVQGNQIELILRLWLDDKGILVTEVTAPAMGGQGGGTTTTKYKKGS